MNAACFMHEKLHLLLLVCPSPAAAQASARSLQGQLYLQTACVMYDSARGNTQISKEHNKATDSILTSQFMMYACS